MVPSHIFTGPFWACTAIADIIPAHIVTMLFLIMTFKFVFYFVSLTQRTGRPFANGIPSLFFTLALLK